jgi:hypothetical protein
MNKIESVVADFVLDSNGQPKISQEVQVIIQRFQCGTYVCYDII